jgi:carbon monoxide dehydrogenase subunit G
MAPIVHDIEISRPPDEVFAYVTDPARFAEWQPDVVSARIEPEGPPAVGARIVTTRRVARTEFTQLQEITEVASPLSWAARGLHGPIRAHARITVDRLREGAACRVTFALDFEGPGIGKLFMPQIRRIATKQAPRSYQNLKERLENAS